MVILIDKPKGITSFGVVARVRRVLTEQENRNRAAEAERTGKQFARIKRVKVGHAGTLDPFATGLLIVLTGQDTKKASDFLKLDKEYRAVIKLGATSTTGDPEGTITEQNVRKKPNKRVVEELVENWPVENWQKVPEYSAIKIGGKRAYKLAREGKKVEMPVRKVMIYEMELLKYEWPILEIRCKVSSGTYIRALGEEIGEKLGTGAYLIGLRRTEIGKWKIGEAKTLGEMGIRD